MPEAERVASGQTNDLSKLADETADLVVLACGLAAHAGFDLSTALARKMLHNVNEREWQPADAEGVIEHVRA
jgi:NTP pyrophosphatase (non-canonical NTP hydrolase)